jgi:hypothetical protein
MPEHFGIKKLCKNQSYTEKKSGVITDYISENLFWILDVNGINRTIPADQEETRIREEKRLF